MRQLEHEVRGVMESVLLGILGEETEAPRATTSGPTLTCSVGIRGEWTGQVIVQATYDLACTAVAKMFGETDARHVTARDAQDALREIANIVAGNLKPMFGDDNQLGFPEDVSGDVLYPGAEQLARVAIVRSDGRLEVRVLEM